LNPFSGLGSEIIIILVVLIVIGPSLDRHWRTSTVWGKENDLLKDC
jgi:hypothetical protein